MGKRKKLNRLIRRWIKSDLPDDRGPVLLLAVTRIPTSPKPLRRPISVGPTAVDHQQNQSSSVQQHQRRNSGSSRRESLRRNSTRRKEVVRQQQAPKFVVTPCLESVVNSTPSTAVFDLSSECSSSAVVSDGGTPTRSFDFTTSDADGVADLRWDAKGRVDSLMDRSVDSIGTCSLDVDASVAESSDWSEISSVGTLRSATLPTPSPEPRLPSYLSLACTVNGYSTTTNYDPDRLARSRDSSPHRPPQHHAQDNLTTYTIHNNLLSPPNLVPLPPVIKTKPPNKMSENGTTMSTTHYRQEFYNNMLTSNYIQTSSTTEKSSKTVVTSRNIFSSDSVDSCIENGYKENKSVETKKLEEITTNGKENKSFIQQRVERLYGPGALAQGFFVMKRQNNSFRSENHNGKTATTGKHSKSMNDKEIEKDLDVGMKQSTSSLSLPVLRHLRPEFRAQLPISVPKKDAEGPMQKSVTVPALAEDNMNGYSTNAAMSCGFIVDSRKANGKNRMNGEDVCDRIEPQHPVHVSGAKDGHHFIKVMEKEAKRLLILADMADEEHETPDLPEEALGYLRSAAGKARLLVTQKMQQFKGLCRNNISQVSGEAFPTTNEDLQGFWDMIMLQVAQIDNLFRDLDTLRDNDWQEEFQQKPVVNGTSKPRKAAKLPSSARPLSAVAEENRKMREAQRKKMIEEKRRLMKEQQQKSKTPRQSIEIYVPESS